MNADRLTYSLPDFLNLGVAPPAPQGATAFAPRAGLHWPSTLGTLFTRVPVATEALLLPTWWLPVSPMFPGTPFAPVSLTSLLPSPYGTGSQ